MELGGLCSNPAFAMVADDARPCPYTLGPFLDGMVQLLASSPCILGLSVAAGAYSACAYCELVNAPGVALSQ